MLTGTLEEFALADVFRLLSWAKRSGKLEIVRSAGQGKIFFREGEVYFAESSISREPLGQKLIRSGALTEGHLMKALDQNAQTGERVGQVLVANGWIEEQQLQTALKQQIEDAVFDLLRWELGDFTYTAGVEADIEVQISVSVENLIIEASRRLDELEVIQRKIPSEMAVLRMAKKPPEGAAEINITPEEWRMLVLVDGERTIHDIAKMVGIDDFGALRGFYGLVSAGLIEVLSEHELAAEAAEAAAPPPVSEPMPAPPQPAATEPVTTQPVTTEPAAEEPTVTVEAPPPVPSEAAEVPAATLPEPPVTDSAAEPTQPVATNGSAPATAFQTAEGGWDENAMSSVFKVQDPNAEPEPVAPTEPATPVEATEAASEEVPVAVESFDAPGPEELVETKPEPFLNDLLTDQALQENVPPQQPPARADNPAPPAPSPLGPRVDRSTVVRELAGLFSDEERPPSQDDPSGNPGSAKKVEDDDELNKGLITRLIDGVKGL